VGLASLEQLDSLFADGTSPSPGLDRVLATARARASAAWSAADGPDARVVVLTAYVADVLTALWLDRDWERESLRRMLERIAERAAVGYEPLVQGVALRVLRDPSLLQLPPTVAVETQLRRLLALAPVRGVSLWTLDSTVGLDRVMHVGETDQAQEEALAGRILDSSELMATAWRRRAVPEGSGDLLVVEVTRWLRPHGALVARAANGSSQAAARHALEEAAASLGPVLEREALLRRSADRERAVVASSERRLERLGLDIHDGPIQDVAALAAEVRLFRAQLGKVLASHPNAAIVDGRVDDLEARLVAVHCDLRELSGSLASPMVLQRPLRELLEQEATMFRTRTAMELRLDMKGDLDSLSLDQRVTLLRIVQEALTNARDHSGASTVSVRVDADRDHVEAEITDDGRGFEVEETIVRAAEHGRLGLVGISERARMVGGTCELRSSIGGPTTISVALPRVDSHADVAARDRQATAR
jgi:signal transduction histidine kinase